jgi:hypothetical protein
VLPPDHQRAPFLLRFTEVWCNRSVTSINMEVNIATCTVVRVTKLTGSSSDDRIYWHVPLQSLLITLNTGLFLNYTLYSSLLHRY